MKIYVGIIEKNCFSYLSKLKPDEVNFWQIEGKMRFKALEPSGLFLFKLRSHLDYIVGGGFFVKQYFLPFDLAWDIFKNENGYEKYDDFIGAICKTQKVDKINNVNLSLGCIVLSLPFFFPKKLWIPVPEDWKFSAKGKVYDTEEPEGEKLYENLKESFKQSKYYSRDCENKSIQYIMGEKGTFLKRAIIKSKLGKGAFKLMVIDAYSRKCAITGENMIYADDTAYIKPNSMGGPNNVNNGLFLRKDLCTLYNKGYITITEDYHILVSKNIARDYGEEYYDMNGEKLSFMPANFADWPSPEYLKWHNKNIFLG